MKNGLALDNLFDNLQWISRVLWCDKSWSFVLLGWSASSSSGHEDAHDEPRNVQWPVDNEACTLWYLVKGLTAG